VRELHQGAIALPEPTLHAVSLTRLRGVAGGGPSCGDPNPGGDRRGGAMRSCFT